jgi:hypothetical protein
VAKVRGCGMIGGRGVRDGRGMEVTEGEKFGGKMFHSRGSEDKVVQVRYKC